MITIGFTGTRKGMTDKQKLALSAFLDRKVAAEIIDSDNGGIVFIHGDCIGADEQAHGIATMEPRCEVWIYPCNLTEQRAFCKGAKIVATASNPLARNHRIVLDCDILVAAPSSLKEEFRSGTWATIRYARKHRTPVKILDP